MIENLDWNIGRIRQALTDAGLADNTHILFFSDHGDMHGSHGAFRKVSPWEEAIRVPFIIGGGGTHYSPYRSARLPLPINHVDIAPTTLGLCGVAIPEWMEGHDYSGCRLEGRPTDGVPDSAFLQSVIPTGHGHSIDRPWRGVVTRDGWKYVVLEGQPWLLFNLNDDPYEQANLAFDLGYRRQRRRLQGLLADWIIATDDAFSLPTI
jgi:arylsulfatase A-like enzyme